MPRIISDLPLFAALIDVAISGSDVPNAIIVNPKNDSDIPRVTEILIAETTVNSAPKIVKKIDIIVTGIPHLRGFLNIMFDKLSFSN